MEESRDRHTLDGREWSVVATIAKLWRLADRPDGPVMVLFAVEMYTIII